MGFRYYEKSVGEAIENIERLDEEELECGYRMAVYGTLYAMEMASRKGSKRTMWEKRKERILASASTLASWLGDKVDSLESKMFEDIESRRYCFNIVEAATKAKKNIHLVLSTTALYSVGGKAYVEGSIERKPLSLRMDGKGNYYLGRYSIHKDCRGWIIEKNCSEVCIDCSHTFTDRDDAVAWAARNYPDRRATAGCRIDGSSYQVHYIPATTWVEEKTRVDLLREARQWLNQNVEGCARYA